MLESVTHFFRHAEPTPLTMAVAFLAVLAFLGLWLAYRHLHQMRIIEDTPTSLIRSAAQGFVEFQGHARLMPGRPIVAPLTGTPCTWYHIKIMERHADEQNGVRAGHWRTLREETSDNLFLVADTTGECVVDPEGAETTPSSVKTWYSDSPTPQFDSNLPATGPFATGRYRYQESLISEYDPLYILGLYKTIGDSADLGSIDEDLRELLRAWKSDPARMKEFDTNGDGVIDAIEWDAARRRARSTVLAERAERSAAGGTNLIMKPLDRRRPFIISTQAPEDIVRQYRWVSRAGWTLFFGSATLALWGLGLRLGA